MHIFITGGTRGIGFGLVKELLKRKQHVSYTGTNDKSISNSIKKLEGDFNAYICDVRNKSQIEEAMNQSIDSFGDIDIWINNAGVDQKRLEVSELSEEEVKRVIDINVLGTINGTSVAIKQMKHQKYGIIYNLEGLGSNNMVIPKTIIYASSKRLISYFCRGCNKELAKEKEIFVGTINPGMVFTDLLLSNMNDDGLKIAKIIGNDVSYISPKIVSKILKGKKKIVVTNNLQIIWRFIKSIFIKQN